MERNTEWTVVRADGDLSLSLGDNHFTGSLTQVPLPQ